MVKFRSQMSKLNDTHFWILFEMQIQNWFCSSKEIMSISIVYLKMDTDTLQQMLKKKIVYIPFMFYNTITYSSRLYN